MGPPVVERNGRDDPRFPPPSRTYCGTRRRTTSRLCIHHTNVSRLNGYVAARPANSVPQLTSCHPVILGNKRQNREEEPLVPWGAMFRSAAYKKVASRFSRGPRPPLGSSFGRCLLYISGIGWLCGERGTAGCGPLPRESWRLRPTCAGARCHPRRDLTYLSFARDIPMTSSPSLHVASFAGSLRKDSYNRALLRNAQEVAPDDMTVEILDIHDIPLYNADVEEQGDPPSVTTFREGIRSADGLLIATPEYNHGVPAVSKNAVDWASRPPRESPLDEKPVALMGASPGMTGTARGQSQLRQAFEFTNSFCMPQPEVLVARAHEKFDDEGRLIHDRTREHLQKFLSAFAEWIRRVEPTEEGA